MRIRTTAPRDPNSSGRGIRLAAPCVPPHSCHRSRLSVCLDSQTGGFVRILNPKRQKPSLRFSALGPVRTHTHRENKARRKLTARKGLFVRRLPFGSYQRRTALGSFRLDGTSGRTGTAGWLEQRIDERRAVPTVVAKISHGPELDSVWPRGPTSFSTCRCVPIRG